MYLNEGLFALSLGRPYEPMETSIINAFVKRGDTVIDLGANVGYYTLLFARLVGQNGRVVAFEPSPANCEILEKNVRINGYRNVEINQMAVSDKSGKARLQLSVNPGDNRIQSNDLQLDKRRKKTVGSSYVEVETVSLDEYFGKSDGNIDFIKMDVQGAEHSAILGMQRTLVRNIKIKILTEFFPKLLSEFGAKPSDYLQLLQQNGFLIYRLDEANCKIVPTSPSSLLRIYSGQLREDYINILLAREHLNESIVPLRRFER